MQQKQRPRPSLTARVRRWHRYLGLVIGIQFLAWVLGGLYFSWMSLDTVHGEDKLGPGPELPADFQPASLDQMLQQLGAQDAPARLQRAELRALPETAVLVVHFSQGDAAQTALFDAATGQQRGPLSEAEATRLAQSWFPDGADPLSVSLIDQTHSHHEYRELPLPAYAIQFDDARRTRIYVAPELARVTSIRNNQWRAFDFLWMLHTMDYLQRDNFNNWILRAFSLLGLATVLSGFWLFFLSRPRKKARLKPDSHA